MTPTNKLERQLINRKHVDTWTSFGTTKLLNKHKHMATDSYRTKVKREVADRDMAKLMKEEWK